MNKYLHHFNQQKNKAKVRGIEWNLSFKEWCDFWGNDIEKRGRGSDKLSMQRIADSGAYAVGNIKKGYMKENAATMGRMRRLRGCENAKKALQSKLDAAIHSESLDAEDDLSDWESELKQFSIQSSQERRYTFIE